MASLYFEKIKPFIKRFFPLVRYRWHIYEAFEKFIYASVGRVCVQNDLSQEIVLPKNCKLEIQTLNESNKGSLAEFIKNHYNNLMRKNWLEYYYKNNYNCFIALLKGNIIGYLFWWGGNDSKKLPTDVIFHDFKIEKNDVCMLSFYIAPEYRGGGNAIEFMTKAFLELKKLGYKRTMGGVDADNLAARWTYRLVGYKEVKAFICHVLFQRIAYVNKAILIIHPYYRGEYRLLLSLRNIF